MSVPTVCCIKVARNHSICFPYKPQQRPGARMQEQQHQGWNPFHLSGSTHMRRLLEKGRISQGFKSIYITFHMRTKTRLCDIAFALFATVSELLEARVQRSAIEALIKKVKNDTIRR